MAVAGLGIVHGQGLRSPEDVSVAGFDGADISRHIFPTLTTVDSDPLAWGRVAASTLLQLISEGQADDVQLPAAQLRIARSTAPPPQPSTSSPIRTAIPATPVPH